MMDSATYGRIAALVTNFSGRKITVLGDLMLDRYIRGSVRRISPEAPVPIVKVTEEFTVCGGAGNVAVNLARLGAKTSIISVTGKDGAAKKLSHELRTIGADASGLITAPETATIEKTRVIAEHQQVVRFDRDPLKPLSPGLEKRVLAALVRQLKNGAEAVIFSDYGKGLLCPGVITKAIGLCRARRVPVFVDPKVEHFRLYKGVACITPNVMEAFGGMGMPQKYATPEVEALGKKIISELRCRSLLITRGEHGMTLFTAHACRPAGMLHIPTKAREVFDVTGAGDTVISLFALAWAAGASPEDAALTANFGAGVVVGKLGTAAVSKEELLESMRSWTKVVLK
ncbi:MAG TPA: D-glycero-beta-D-manno-heptose-7-phosphate kinase [Elusimicrobia bacterium]|nr:D-glycero-beta-D-manno-heptose-7-phosphate kinase [Elusimicrobiota bacterium]HCE98757.1 D-glycero-beta-D-manno-heptose-7-phosphate kinase [Elusimicrobiota bacterium]